MMLKRTSFVTRAMAAAAAIALLGLTLSSGQAATVDFFDDFNDTNLDDFSISGNFGMNGTVLSYGGGGESFASVELTNADGVDLVMTATFEASAFTGSSDAGFFAFADVAASIFSPMYLADFKADGRMRILGPPGVLTTTIASAPLGSFTFDTSETYALTLRITPLGNGTNDMTLTLNDPSIGDVVISGNSIQPAATGNFFGFRVNPATTQLLTFDDFSVAQIPEPNSIVLVALGLVGMIPLRKRNRC